MTRQEWLAKREALAAVFADAEKKPDASQLDVTMRQAFGACPDDPMQPFGWVNIYTDGKYGTVRPTQAECVLSATADIREVVCVYRHPRPAVVPWGFVNDSPASFGEFWFDLATAKMYAGGASVYRLYRAAEAEP